MSSYVDWAVLRNVAVTALLAGVGLTVLFAVGARNLDRADRQAAAGQSPTAARAVGAAAMVLVAAAVLVGVWAVLAK